MCVTTKVVGSKTSMNFEIFFFAFELTNFLKNCRNGTKISWNRNVGVVQMFWMNVEYSLEKRCPLWIDEFSEELQIKEKTFVYYYDDRERKRTAVKNCQFRADNVSFLQDFLNVLRIYRKLVSSKLPTLRFHDNFSVFCNSSQNSSIQSWQRFNFQFHEIFPCSANL